MLQDSKNKQEPFRDFALVELTHALDFEFERDGLAPAVEKSPKQEDFMKKLGKDLERRQAWAKGIIDNEMAEGNLKPGHLVLVETPYSISFELLHQDKKTH